MVIKKPFNKMERLEEKDVNVHLYYNGWCVQTTLLVYSITFISIPDRIRIDTKVQSISYFRFEESKTCLVFVMTNGTLESTKEKKE